jgi:hypothetical protein
MRQLAAVRRVPARTVHSFLASRFESAPTPMPVGSVRGCASHRKTGHGGRYAVASARMRAVRVAVGAANPRWASSRLRYGARL